MLVGGGGARLEGELADGLLRHPDDARRPDGPHDGRAREIFGPVVVVETWSDEDDVVARANDSEYGLAAGRLDARPRPRAPHRRASSRRGTVWVNTWFDRAAGQPLGGVKRSGFGREMCAETLLEYSAPKAISMSLDTARPGLWGGRSSD